MRNFVLICALFSMGASCRPLPEDNSAFASEAGQSTIVLGSCESNFNVGWANCLLEKGSSSFPTLKLIFTNPGEYAVSDCMFGLHKTGHIEAPGIYEVDLSGLKTQAENLGLCLLKIEATERYPDPHDKNQLRSIFMRGGMFIELVDAGYMPTPANDMVAFCVQVMRTTKGRTRIEKCRPK